MRIVSKFSDYYDSAMSVGQDQSLVYNRHPITKELDRYPFFQTDSKYPLGVRSYTIGFCGKLYKLLELTDNNTIGCPKEIRSSRKIAYCIKDVDSYVHQHFPRYYDSYASKEWIRNPGPLRGLRRSFDEYFTGYAQKAWGRSIEWKENNAEWVVNLFRENCSPVFVAEKNGETRGKITFNAELKSFEFYRVFDSYAAYQEISMWLANQAIPIKPIPEIPDKIMLEAKGFDKFSFRKDPSSKKRKR